MGSSKYGYDDLGRSVSVGCGSKGSQSYTYDAFGNIFKTANGMGLSFQPSTYNAANQPVGYSMSFDADGNMLKDNQSVQYTWDPNFGNPASIGTTNLVYDAQGQMVEQQSGSNYTQMLYSQVGKTAIMNGQALKSTGLSDAGPVFIPLPGGATAIYNSSGTLANFRHADWLGSSHLTTTASGTVASTSAYAPFGEQYATSGTTDASFTGQNSDTNSNLYDFTFREYSPSQGRWVSPDPAGVAVANPANPQSWNRYTYAMNNPMSNIDPSGLDSCYEDGSYGTCGGLAFDFFFGAGGGGGGGCSIDGGGVPCQMISNSTEGGGGAGGGALVQCPNNSCGPIWGADPYTGNNTWLSFTAGAGGATGYLSLHDWTEGVNELDGKFLNDLDYMLKTLPKDPIYAILTKDLTPNDIQDAFKKILDEIAKHSIPASPWKTVSGIANCAQNFSNDITQQIVNNFPNVSNTQAEANFLNCTKGVLNGMEHPF